MLSISYIKNNFSNYELQCMNFIYYLIFYNIQFSIESTCNCIFLNKKLLIYIIIPYELKEFSDFFLIFTFQLFTQLI